VQHDSGGPLVASLGPAPSRRATRTSVDLSRLPAWAELNAPG